MIDLFEIKVEIKIEVAYFRAIFLNFHEILTKFVKVKHLYENFHKKFVKIHASKMFLF